MNLPPAVDIDFEAVKERHGLQGAVQPLAAAGVFNTVYAIGADLILRVPRDDPFFVATAFKELRAVPAARAAGVRTPAIVVADTACDTVRVPYAVYERAHGETLESLAPDPAKATPVWEELGRDLALLHTRVGPDDDLAGLVCEDVPDARTLLEGAASRGHLSAVEEQWLAAWLDNLAPADAGAIPCFVHGDIQSSNVIATTTPDGGAYVAVLDWGGCGWVDPARDFAGIPLRAVPAMLRGYATVAGDADDAFRARIVHRHLQLALFNLGRGPQPAMSWAERQASMLVDVLRFFVDAPREWSAVRPPRA